MVRNFAKDFSISIVKLSNLLNIFKGELEVLIFSQCEKRASVKQLILGERKRVRSWEKYSKVCET